MPAALFPWCLWLHRFLQRASCHGNAYQHVLVQADSVRGDKQRSYAVINFTCSLRFCFIIILLQKQRLWRGCARRFCERQKNWQEKEILSMGVNDGIRSSHVCATSLRPHLGQTHVVSIHWAWTDAFTLSVSLPPQEIHMWLLIQCLCSQHLTGISFYPRISASYIFLFTSFQHFAVLPQAVFLLVFHKHTRDIYQQVCLEIFEIFSATVTRRCMAYLWYPTALRESCHKNILPLSRDPRFCLCLSLVGYLAGFEECMFVWEYVSFGNTR